MEEGTPKTTAATKGARDVKVSDTVHLVRFDRNAQAKIVKVHCDAKVEKVHKGGKFIDLAVEHDDPDQVIRVSKSPRDDAGERPDSWHFPETE
jgi:hypothetical protein